MPISKGYCLTPVLYIRLDEDSSNAQEVSDFGKGRIAVKTKSVRVPIESGSGSVRFKIVQPGDYLVMFGRRLAVLTSEEFTAKITPASAEEFNPSRLALPQAS